MGYAKPAQQQLAAKFIKTLFDRSVVRQMNLVGAAQNAIFLSPVISNADTIDAYPADVLKTIKSQLRNAQGPPNCNGWEDSQAGVTTAIQNFLFGSATAKAALNEAAAVMKSKL